MAEQHYRVQVIGLPTLVPRSPVPEREGLVQAATAGGASSNQRHPDLPAQVQVSSEWGDARGRKSQINPPPPIDPPTGPPPAFEANVLEVQSRGRHYPVDAERAATDAPELLEASVRQWQAPATPEPALINFQL